MIAELPGDASRSRVQNDCGAGVSPALAAGTAAPQKEFLRRFRQEGRHVDAVQGRCGTADLAEMRLAISPAPTVEGLDQRRALHRHEHHGRPSPMAVQFGDHQRQHASPDKAAPGPIMLQPRCPQETRKPSSSPSRCAYRHVPEAVAVRQKILEIFLPRDAGDFHFQCHHVGNVGGRRLPHDAGIGRVRQAVRPAARR